MVFFETMPVKEYTWIIAEEKLDKNSVVEKTSVAAGYERITDLI